MPDFHKVLIGKWMHALLYSEATFLCLGLVDMPVDKLKNEKLQR